MLVKGATGVLANNGTKPSADIMLATKWYIYMFPLKFIYYFMILCNHIGIDEIIQNGRRDLLKFGGTLRVHMYKLTRYGNYGDSHYKDKAVAWPPYLNHGNPWTISLIPPDASLWSIHWLSKCHNIVVTSHGRQGVSNHRHLYCLLNNLYRLTSKKTSKLRIIGPLIGESTSAWGAVMRKGFPYHDVIIRSDRDFVGHFEIAHDLRCDVWSHCTEGHLTRATTVTLVRCPQMYWRRQKPRTWRQLSSH